MNVRDFRDLLVWQKSHAFTLEIYKITKSFPAEERFGLISQMRRSSVSVCANIAEGLKKTTKDFQRFLDISQGSLEETKYYLILSKDLKYFEQEQFEHLFSCSEEVGKMLNGLKRKLY